MVLLARKLEIIVVPKVAISLPGPCRALRPATRLRLLLPFFLFLERERARGGRALRGKSEKNNDNKKKKKMKRERKGLTEFGSEGGEK